MKEIVAHFKLVPFERAVRHLVAQNNFLHLTPEEVIKKQLCRQCDVTIFINHLDKKQLRIFILNHKFSWP